MKTLTFLFFIVLLPATGCRRLTDMEKIYVQAEKEFFDGNLKTAMSLLDSVKKSDISDAITRAKADSLYRISGRLYIDFSLTEEQVNERLKKAIGTYSDDDLRLWEEKNWLEYRIIDGEKRYFNRAVSNLELVKSFNLQRAARDSLEAGKEFAMFLKKHSRSVIDESGSSHMPVVPVEMLVNYTLTVYPNAVPEGEIVKCWLPWPKENNARQQEVRLISASDDDYLISPDSMTHRSIYMEAVAEKDKPVIFNASFSYSSSAQYFDPGSLEILPYKRDSELYRKYSSEQLPHINFSEEVRLLADSIAGKEDDPLATLRKLYYWINDNIPWAGAIEYSLMPDIPRYVLANRRGDCGMQTFLLMSMLRYRGIPVRWQSGWMMHPGNENLHDWCEVYFEGPGWVPVDMSFGLQYSDNMATREFYMTGIDSYRLIVNDGVSGSFYPPKKYLRSEPYDFQRGEVEWSGGNLYFDRWDYNMEITYK